jgi:DNA polymerase IV
MSSARMLRSFPRAIMHIDGDAFFASCEQAMNPRLKGKMVVTGKERGIVSSMSYEAKACGISRAMPLYEVKRRWPQAVILPSDYESYALFSLRMFDIVRRYTPDVEAYSIDECFADITGLRRPLRRSYPAIAAATQHDVEQELGCTFSLGLAPNKTLAKIASTWKKPSGLTCIPGRDIHRYLRVLPAGQVWGIGGQTTALLMKYGIRSALDFAQRDEAWVQQHVSKPYHDTWRELNGEYVLALDVEAKQSYQSISKTKTFTPPSSDPARVFSELAKNVENACIKARRYQLFTKDVLFYLKTQDFVHRGLEIHLSRYTAFPNEIIAVIRPTFNEVFRPGERYRATGVTLLALRIYHERQLDLFEDPLRVEKMERLFGTIDQLARRFGKHAVHLGSSLQTHQLRQHLGARGVSPGRMRRILRGENQRQRIGIPLLEGDVQ